MRFMRNLTHRPAAVLLMVLGLTLAAGAAVADTGAVDRAAWLLNRGQLADYALTGLMVAQGEVGTGGGEYDFSSDDSEGTGTQPALRMLASLVLPGAGEALGGHKRGYLMMALDIYAWTRVSKYHGDGKDLTDDYYAFADKHYTDAALVEGYRPGSLDPRGGLGAVYFPDIPAINDESELDRLPLYVTVEADRREYYENLGKWDQFIFGWDDFTRPDSPPPGIEYTPTETISDLRQPWVSYNRETYRTMRAEANDAYKTRDRWLYLNIGLRVFSVLQVAYLEGLLGGDDDELAVLGHPVQIIAQPTGPYRGTVGASVAF